MDDCLLLSFELRMLFSLHMTTLVPMLAFECAAQAEVARARCEAATLQATRSVYYKRYRSIEEICLHQRVY